MNDIATHAWLRRVSEYHSGGVSAAERTAVEEHLVTCAECQEALAAYRRFYTISQALPQLGDGAEVAISGYRAIKAKESTHPVPMKRMTESSETRWHSSLAPLEVIAAILLVALLAAVLLVLHRYPLEPATPRPVPTLTAQEQAYVGFLRAYYVPLANDNPPAKNCLERLGDLAPATRLQQMPACRPLVAAELAAARTFQAQLANISPPIGWQGQNVARKQATQALIDVLATEIRDIDAGDVARFLGDQDLATQALRQFYDPIVQINAQVGAGPPPRASPLPIMDPDFLQYVPYGP